VDSPGGPTRDGIDIVDCTDVLIQRSTVNSEDDSFCLKSGSAKGVHNVTIKDSVVENSGVANALKLGTASTGSFDGIRFVGIRIKSAKQAAMAVESVDGSDIHGVTFKDIEFQNVGTAVFVLLGLRNGTSKVGSINNIFFENITGTTRLNWGSALSGSVVAGKTYFVTNVSFTNVNVTNLSSGGLSTAPPAPAEYAGGYPDPRLFGPPPLPAFGYYIRHAIGVSFVSSLNKKAEASDPRQEFVTEDVTKFTQQP